MEIFCRIKAKVTAAEAGAASGLVQPKWSEQRHEKAQNELYYKRLNGKFQRLSKAKIQCMTQKFVASMTCSTELVFSFTIWMVQYLRKVVGATIVDAILAPKLTRNLSDLRNVSLAIKLQFINCYWKYTDDSFYKE